MRHFTRGTQVDFSIKFYDANGAVSVPESVTLHLKYPGPGYPLDGSDLKEATIAMALASDGETWEASWDSVSGKGIVYWAAKASDPALTLEQGRFEVRGNAATLAATD